MLVEIKCSKNYLSYLLIASSLLNANLVEEKKMQVLTLPDYISICIFQY